MFHQFTTHAEFAIVKFAKIKLGQNKMLYSVFLQISTCL